MDNYRVLSVLAHTPHSCVCKVEDKRNNQEYVLKQVECDNEPAANKAFREALSLESLSNPYLCKHQEFFVSWDEKQFSVYVCIVMEYYPQGDLEHYLSTQRSLHQAVKENTLKKWVGQAIEAMAHIHEKQLVHRNLKPSNIFLTDDLSVSVGDFNVTAPISETQPNTRTAIGNTAWIAPEVLDSSFQQYDERSDIWSLGCVLLCMSTCSFLTEPQIKASLFQIKVSSEAVEDILAKVSEVYSPQLSSLIQLMLRRSYHQRPTSLDLLDHSYVRECLAEYQSPLLQQLAAPKDIQDELLTQMKRAGSSADIQAQCMMKFHHLLATEGSPTPRAALLRQVQLIMGRLLSNADIQCLGLRLFYLVYGEGSEQIITTDVISLTCSAMKQHSSHYDTQLAVSSLLMVISAEDSATSSIERSSTIQVMMKTLKQFHNMRDLVANHLVTITNLSTSASSTSILVEEGVVHAVCRAVREHIEDQELMDAGCSALWSLSLSDEAVVLMVEENVAKLLYQCIKQHSQKASIVKFSCATLANLVDFQGECAYAVFSSVGPEDGLVGLLAAIKLHSLDDDVTHHALHLLRGLLQLDDILEELSTRGVAEFIKNLHNCCSEEMQTVVTSIAKLFATQ